MSAPARDVDDYLTAVPERERATLEMLRKTIKAAAPEAAEVISYQVPTYKYHGSLVAFWVTKSHCAFCVMSPSVMDARRDELKPYDTAKATIRFPAEKPIPEALVRKLVRARIEENEARLVNGHR